VPRGPIPPPPPGEGVVDRVVVSQSSATPAATWAKRS
jgi:hypothetical protein